ncbi:MAG TPA: DUF4365 domain-containing protein [Pirellulaceae bacterium]|nr:DUF4365 domain-containing protein [Pirellulaceae bacterium]
MKRPKAHKINEIGKRIFEEGIPADWLVNAQTNDYGKDYLIEIGNTVGELSGDSFYVQLKSSGSIKKVKSLEFCNFVFQDQF